MSEFCLICGKTHHGAIRGGKVSRLTSCFRFTRQQRKAEKRESAASTLSRARERLAEMPVCHCGARLTAAHIQSCHVWRSLLEGAAKGAQIVYGRNTGEE